MGHLAYPPCPRFNLCNAGLQLCLWGAPQFEQRVFLQGVGTSAALIKRMGLYQRWSFEDGRGGTGDEHTALEASPIRAPGHVLVIFVVYYLPLFILGLTGWLIRHWPVTNTGCATPCPCGH